MMGETLTPRALTRRLKRHLYKAPQRFMAVCAPGLEPYLLSEVQALGVSEAVPVSGGVEFVGPLDLSYAANLWLRTAHRVLLRIDDFLAQSLPMLYNRARRIPWELYLGFSPTVSLRVSAKASRLQQGAGVANTLYQAILARLTPLGLQPVHTEDAPLEILVRLFQDRCTLSLNTSGLHLHKRGYRLATAKAPLRETLAAGIAMACQAQRYDLIVDPMCGSGTLLIEAGLLAAGIPPGGQRAFAFEQAPFFQPGKWRRLKESAMSQRRPAPIVLLGSDLDPGAVRAARSNAHRAGLELAINQADALRLPYDELSKQGARRLLLCNLPYGQRIEEGRLRRLVAVLRRACSGWDYALLAQPHQLEAGLKPTRQLALNNGGIPVMLAMGQLVDFDRVEHAVTIDQGTII
jgi:putative N6-adenine-specific DNA methylase